MNTNTWRRVLHAGVESVAIAEELEGVLGDDDLTAEQRVKLEAAFELALKLSCCFPSLTMKRPNDYTGRATYGETKVAGITLDELAHEISDPVKGAE